MTETDKPTVATPSASHQATLPKWNKIDALMNGTDRMRKEGQTYLPAFPAESDNLYRHRLARSFLYPGLSDTIEKAVSRVFSKTVSVTAKVMPDVLAAVIKDADLRGTSLHDFLRQWFEYSIRHGVAYCFVDMPANPTRSPRGRPYLRLYRAPSLIAHWDEIDEASGETYIAHCRLREVYTRREGEYGEKKVEQILRLDAVDTGKGKRAVTATRWEKQKTDRGEFWVMVGPPSPVDLGTIPLVPHYTNQCGFLEGEPPLEGLADLNIEHWQSSSDQKNILHVARVPQLVQSGGDDEDKDKEPTIIGTSRIHKIPVDAKMYWAEHTGAAIGAGHADIVGIEERMANLGHQIYTARKSTVTATGENIDAAKSTSALQEWVQALEQSTMKVLGLVVAWQRLNGEPSLELPEDLRVDVYDDFGVGRSPAEFQPVLEMHKAGILDDRTTLQEGMRRGHLSEFTDIEKVLKAVEERRSEDLRVLAAAAATAREEEPEEEEEAVGAA